MPLELTLACILKAMIDNVEKQYKNFKNFPLWATNKEKYSHSITIENKVAFDFIHNFIKLNFI